VGSVVLVEVGVLVGMGVCVGLGRAVSVWAMADSMAVSDRLQAKVIPIITMPINKYLAFIFCSLC
jgi:hypothetical protein